MPQVEPGVSESRPVSLDVRVCADAGAAAAATAEFIAAAIREAVSARGRCGLALSGGSDPRPLFVRLASLDVPWPQVRLFQVDERAVPPRHPERNWRSIEDLLLASAPIPIEHRHPLPVDEPDPAPAARSYSRALEQECGKPPLLDVVHLGLGRDAHTASLFPEDPALGVRADDVTPVAPHEGFARMSLTLPALNRARRLVWLVTGAQKREALAKLRSGTPARLPANQIRRRDAVVFCDADAVGSSAQS